MYKWYDKIKEPNRFLIFFIPTALLIVGVNVSNLYVNVACWILLLTLLGTRMVYIHKGKRYG
ncbi:hypothetical protein LCGC14_1968630 [marine sediment metagenome]|uniref:Uncharacterized protein n=1 Tax=marine sediment metagenome TaxID=412755 RepID=A0A0F9G0M0_9ZZZZ